MAGVRISKLQNLLPMLKYLVPMHPWRRRSIPHTFFAAAGTTFGPNLSGEYLQAVAKTGMPSRQAQDAKLAQELWESRCRDSA